MIHESAIISKKAEIPSDITIGVNCIIGDNVKIGKNCTLKDNVRIVGNTTIGCGNTFFSNSVIGEVPQDKKYYGEKPILLLEMKTLSENLLRLIQALPQVEAKQ